VVWEQHVDSVSQQVMSADPYPPRENIFGLATSHRKVNLSGPLNAHAQNLVALVIIY
jgi:hypothetical protein